MKMKIRELIIAAMLIVMAAAVSVTMVSCSSDKEPDGESRTKVEAAADTEDDQNIEADDGDTDKSSGKAEKKTAKTDKTDSKSDSKSESSKKETTKSAEPVTEPTTKAPDVCYISIEGYCSGKSITLQGGDTVYSILCRSGASVSGSGHYVKGINGKYEFDEGPTSGWVYYVNGSKPGVGCGSCSVKAGDNIKWDYVTSY